jgi:hypothetical protein
MRSTRKQFEQSGFPGRPIGADIADVVVVWAVDREERLVEGIAPLEG